MRTDPRPDEVRRIVERVFSGYQDHGRRGKEGGKNRIASRFPRVYRPPEEDRGQDCPEIDETILIDQGRYVARSYRVKGYLAMWMVAMGIVQFYDDQGRMLGTVNLFESLRPQRMAA